MFWKEGIGLNIIFVSTLRSATIYRAGWVLSITFCFNAINSSTHVCPYYIMQYLHSLWSLRYSADTHVLTLPLYGWKTKGDRAFSHFGLYIYVHYHSILGTRKHTFRSVLKTYLHETWNMYNLLLLFFSPFFFHSV